MTGTGDRYGRHGVDGGGGGAGGGGAATIPYVRTAATTLRVRPGTGDRPAPGNGDRPVQAPATAPAQAAATVPPGLRRAVRVLPGDRA